MRIVHLIHYFQPRLGYQETHLARQQMLRGHEVTVLTSDRFYPFPDYEGTIGPLLGDRILTPGRTVEEGIPVWRLPIRFENEAHKRCWMVGTRAALEELRPDVVHAHGVVEFPVIEAALAQPRLGYRLVVDNHDLWCTVQTNPVGKLFYAAFRLFVTPLLVRRAAAFVAVYDQSADVMRELFGLDKVPISVIELGVDADTFRQDEEVRKTQRARLGVSDDDFLVVYTGKLIPSKDPRLLLEALAGCPANVKALFVGNGSAAYVDGMMQTIAKHGLEGRVFFEPACPQDELPRHYAAGDAACWPREASMAMLEAASCSLPIVVVRGGLQARIANRNGLDYEQGDTDELARLLTSLATDRVMAKAMGDRGRELVERAFTWKAINEAFEKVYTST